MKAIVKTKRSIKLKKVDKPKISSNKDVLIAVKYAGFCRTDMFVGEGIVPCSDGTILGHEFSGVIEKIWDEANKFNIGDRVTVMPIISCGTCVFCKSNQKDKCQNTVMLGTDCNGAFAEYISVPQEMAYHIPDNISFKQGAYTEPLAAALSIMKAGIEKEEKGIIYGNNRFSKLIVRIMNAYGFDNISIYDPESAKSLKKNYYDYAIETLATEKTMEVLFEAVKPSGKIVIKSRKHSPVGINFNKAIKKELNICAVNYGNFEESIRLMSDELIATNDLFGESYKLEDFKKVFSKAKSFEGKKMFFKIAD